MDQETTDRQIEWKGVNKMLCGALMKDKDGVWIIKMENGHTFHANDIRYAKSAKLIE